jgi:hypothetical protein
MYPFSRTLSRAVRAGLVLALVFAATGCDNGDPDDGEVVVMSTNLYLGADLFLVANEPNAFLIPLRVAELYGMVQQTDFPARAEAIADEIDRPTAGPHRPPGSDDVRGPDTQRLCAGGDGA